MDAFFEIRQGRSPVIAAAIHAGHRIRPDTERHMALSATDRLREEDPYTDRWTHVADTRVIVHGSRFEVDLNRPRHKAVYREPSDAWGLRVWKAPPSEERVEKSLETYDRFYRDLFRLLDRVQERYGHFVVLDLHSYNHRRAGPGNPPDDPDANPDINVGTGTMDRDRWAPVVDRFIDGLRSGEGAGGRLDVRENVKFRGGNFPAFVHDTFPETGCALAVEVKKFFMDEWSGRPDWGQIARVREILRSTIPGLLETLRQVA